MSDAPSDLVRVLGWQDLGWIGFSCAAVLTLFSTIVWVFLKPYVERWAEHLATREQFAEVLDMQKAETLAVEGIKSSVSSGMWLDQERWKRKIEVFTELLDYLLALEVHARSGLVRKGGTAKSRSLDYYVSISKETKSRAELPRSRVVGRLILRPALMKSFDEAEQTFKELAYGPKEWLWEPDSKNARQHVSLLSWLVLSKFEEAAREDISTFSAADQALLEERDARHGRAEVIEARLRDKALPEPEKNELILELGDLLGWDKKETEES